MEDSQPTEFAKVVSPGDTEAQREVAGRGILTRLSKALDNDTFGLEAAALDPTGALDVFRLAVAAAAGQWRRDPAVQVTLAQQAYCWAGGAIPAILDGESVRLGRTAVVRFKPNAFRALVPREAV